MRPKSALTGWGRGFESGLEFALCVVVGAAIGFFLDRWLGSEPWLLLVFMAFGFAAGLRVLLRGAQAAGPNLVCVYGEPGSASAIARALEAEEFDGLVGTVAGDDTVFVAVDRKSSGEAVLALIQSLVE